MRTRVKICGFTRTEDALAAARLGVDAIGLVFYPPSPRHVGLETAKTIIAALPPFVSVVGLFVDEEPERIRTVLEQVPLDILQFHGDEPAHYCEQFGRAYLKAIRMKADTDLLALAAQYQTAAGLLLDADAGQAKGGTGTGFDWDLIPKLCPLPLVLAGGLDAAKVRQAISQVRPFGLDVSSGVESAKGIKDHNKMAAFIKEVQDFDQSN